MKIKSRKLFICQNLLLIFTLTACLEEFSLPATVSNENILIVEGNISNLTAKISSPFAKLLVRVSLMF
ncbi:MAG: hypothetical protein AAGI07_10705, partial [Bacteroidota bacterium]